MAWPVAPMQHNHYHSELKQVKTEFLTFLIGFVTYYVSGKLLIVCVTL